MFKPVYTPAQQAVNLGIVVYACKNEKTLLGKS
jgi:hypothetical protein